MGRQIGREPGHDQSGRGCPGCYLAQRVCYKKVGGAGSRQYVNEWVWLCAHKALFIKAGKWASVVLEAIVC